MELDLETFLTTLYVMTDDLYASIRPAQDACDRRTGAQAERLRKCCAWVWPPSGARACPGRPSAALCAMP